MMTWRADPQVLAGKLSNHFGLHFQGLGKWIPGGSATLEISPAGVHPNDSFRLIFELGWRSLEAHFIPGSFAGHLITEMQKAALSDRQTFGQLADKILLEKAKLRMNVNGVDVNPLHLKGEVENWRDLKLDLQKTPLGINTEDHEESSQNLEVWAFRFTGLVFSLLPVEATDSEDVLNPLGLPEGSKVRVEVNRYERNAVNRANCIELQGESCKACGFNFAAVYGALGTGFIHVHHVVPVSQLGSGYVVDPAVDLVPLCPNCHAMVHKTDPPLSVDQLKAILRELPVNELSAGR
jgi:5-methylcytosine-specific restriction protein A